MALFYPSANLFKVWLHQREQDSLTCICAQVITLWIVVWEEKPASCRYAVRNGGTIQTSWQNTL